MMFPVKFKRSTDERITTMMIPVKFKRSTIVQGKTPDEGSHVEHKWVLGRMLPLLLPGALATVFTRDGHGYSSDLSAVRIDIHGRYSESDLDFFNEEPNLDGE